MDKTEREAARPKDRIQRKMLGVLARGAIFTFAGYLSGLCVLPFGARPFGIALLAAADRNAPFVLAGLVAAALGVYEGYAAAVAVGTYCALFLLRILLRLTVASPFERDNRPDKLGRFDEKEGKHSLGELFGVMLGEARGYRVCSSAVASLSLSFAFLAGGGFLYYDLFALLLNVLISPLACFLLCPFFLREGGEGARRGDGAAFAAFLLLCAICSRGGADLKIYGVSLCVGLGIFCVLEVCAKRGALRGLLSAAAIGLPYSVALSPIFALAALAHLAFSRISANLVAAATLFGSLFYSFYVRGIHALDGVAGGIITAVLIFSASSKLGSLKKPNNKEESAERESREGARADVKSERGERARAARCAVLFESELDGVRLCDINRRTARLKESVAKLSELFENIKLKFPRRAELAQICKAAFGASCVGCSEQARCRNEKAQSELCRTLGAELEIYGRVESKSFPPSLAAHCPRLPDIIDEINYNYSIRFRGACEADGDFFLQSEYSYRAISALFALSCKEEEYRADAAASAALCRVVDELGKNITGAIVYGERRRRILLCAEDADALERACRKGEMTEAVRRSLGFEAEYAGRTFRELHGRGAVELAEKPVFSAQSYSCRYSADGAQACGDSVELFESRDACFYCVMSDGMGSGRDAALTSELSVGFMKNMLEGTELSEELIGALNSLLRSRTDGGAKECSATLDLLRLDLVSGRATFCKCGAAPSYVYRRGNLFKLRSRTMPLGILAEADSKTVELGLDEGDVVIMMSDGVSGGREECPYLFDLLRQNIGGADIGRCAELIVKYARAEGSVDDISVAIVRVGRLGA